MRVQGEFLECRDCSSPKCAGPRLWAANQSPCDAHAETLVDANFLFSTGERRVFMLAETATPVKAILGHEHHVASVKLTLPVPGIPARPLLAISLPSHRPNHHSLHPGGSTIGSPPAAKPRDSRRRSINRWRKLVVATTNLANVSKYRPSLERRSVSGILTSPMFPNVTAPEEPGPLSRQRGSRRWSNT